MAMSRQEREILENLKTYVDSERDAIVELVNRQIKMMEKLEETCLKQQRELVFLRAPKPKTESMNEDDLSQPLGIWWDNQEQRYFKIDHDTKDLLAKKKSTCRTENWYHWKRPLDRPIIIRRLLELTRQEGSKAVIHTFTEPKNEAKDETNIYREVVNKWEDISRLYDLKLLSMQEWDTIRKICRKELGLT